MSLLPRSNSPTSLSQTHTINLTRRTYLLRHLDAAGRANRMCCTVSCTAAISRSLPRRARPALFKTALLFQRTSFSTDPNLRSEIT